MYWNFNPIFIDLGFLKIHYYGICFATGIMIAYFCWRWQMTRQGYSEKTTEDFVMWAFLAVIVGARLGHCFFYEPKHYLSHPWEIIKIWEGGLSSHGATITIILALFFFHRIKKIPLGDICDCFSFSAGVAAIAIRIGNFFNSEIVGRVTDVPWAIRFVRFEAEPKPRHPSQLYEVGLGLLVVLSLWLVDRHYKEKRPRGILAGVFLVVYFTGRFLVEYFKEYQALPNTFPLTMGQILSIPFALAGYFILIRIFIKSSSKKQ